MLVVLAKQIAERIDPVAICYLFGMFDVCLLGEATEELV